MTAFFVRMRGGGAAFYKVLKDFKVIRDIKDLND